MQFLVEHNWSSPWHNARTTREIDGTLHQFSFYEISLLGDPNYIPGVDGIDNIIVPSNSLNFSTIEYSDNSIKSTVLMPFRPNERYS